MIGEDRRMGIFTKSTLAVGFLFFSFFLLAPRAHAATYAPSTIVADTEWVIDGSPYIVNDLSISSGATLTIDAGVVVKFSNTASSIKVEGMLNANGAWDNPIYFTSIKDDAVGGDTNNDGNATMPAAENWNSILVGRQNPNAVAAFEYAIIRYAGFGNCWGWCSQSGIYVGGGQVTLSDSRLSNNSQFGILQNAGIVTVFNTELDHERTGLYLAAGDCTVSSSNFHDLDDVGLNGSGGNLTLAGSLFADNGAAISVSGPVNFWHYGNTAAGTGRKAITVNMSVTINQTFTADLPYVVNGLTINPGATLTVEAGVFIKMAPAAAIAVDGTLNVNGTDTDPVYITSLKDDAAGGDTNNDGDSTTPTPGDWNGISIGLNSSSASASFEHAIIEYPGYANCWGWCSQSAIYARRGNVQIADSHIRFSGQYGIRQDGGSVSVASSEIDHNQIAYWMIAGAGIVSDSRFHDNVAGAIISNSGDLTVVGNEFANNGYTIRVSGVVNLAHSDNIATGTGIRGIEIGGVISQNQTWTADLPYVIDGLTVAAGAALTINPGVVVKFEARLITIDGSLIANGAIDNPIYFTSFHDDSVGGDTNGNGTASVPTPGDWDSILIGLNNPSASGSLDRVIIKYGGSNSCTWSLCYKSSIYLYNGNLSLADSHVSYSAENGIRQRAGSAVINTTEFDHNNIGYFHDYGDISVEQSSFHDDAYSGLLNTSQSTISVINNWWGSVFGPHHDTNLLGTGDVIYGQVSFTPWLTSDPFSS